jgi:hypothetical protein
VDESAPEGEAPDSRQTDGEGWQTPSAEPVLPAVRLCCAAALVLPADLGKEGLGGIPGRLLLTRQRQHPCGRVALAVTPPPLHPASTRTLFLPTLLTRKSEHQWGHRQGQEVSRAERAEREERPARLTSCPQDTRPTLWPGHRPFLPIMRGRRPAKLSVHRRCAWCTALRRYG